MYHFDWSEIRPMIKDTILSIEKHNEIDSEFTGYIGKTSQSWHTQNWLISQATTSELEKLITYDNSAVRGIVFEALINRKHPNLYNYIIQSVDYKKPVYVQFGCLIDSFGLTEYYLFKTSDKVVRSNYKNQVKEGLFTENQIIVLDSISKTKTRFFEQ